MARLAAAALYCTALDVRCQTTRRKAEESGGHASWNSAAGNCANYAYNDFSYKESFEALQNCIDQLIIDVTTIESEPQPCANAPP